MTSNVNIVDSLYALSETDLTTSIESDDKKCIVLTLKIGSDTCKIARMKSGTRTSILVEVILSKDEQAIFDEIGTRTWRYLVEMGIMRQNNSEVFMLDTGDFHLVDYIFDDAFSIHLLYKRARAIVSDMQRFRGDIQRVLDIERLRQVRQELEADLRKTMKRRGPRPTPPDGMYI